MDLRILRVEDIHHLPEGRSFIGVGADPRLIAVDTAQVKTMLGTVFDELGLLLLEAALLAVSARIAEVAPDG